MKIKNLNFLPLICCLFLLFGCAEKEPVTYTRNEIEEKFVKFCQEDLDIEHVTVRTVGKTFWVYIPFEENIFDYKAADTGDVAAQQPKAFFSVQFADVAYKDKTFNAEVDIVTRFRLDEPPGYKTAYTDKATKVQRNIFIAIQRIFAGSLDPESDTPIPDFIVLTQADITRGMATEMIMYFPDYKEYSHGMMPYEEYSQRIVNDTKGRKALIGDKEGLNLKYRDIQLGDFLAEQMVNRIRFKYQDSAFPPGTNNIDEIVPIIANTLRYYKFEDYEQVIINDLRQDVKASFDPTTLKTFEETQDNPEPKGRLINIRFDGTDIEAWDEQ